jgi:hypothetical protein
MPAFALSVRIRTSKVPAIAQSGPHTVLILIIRNGSVLLATRRRYCMNQAFSATIQL